MRTRRDSVWWWNFVGIGFMICLGFGWLAANLYKNFHYSIFQFTVANGAIVRYIPLFGQGRPVPCDHPTKGQCHYHGLHISWWGDHTPAYLVTAHNRRELWFRVNPMVNGDVRLIPANEGTRLGEIDIEIKDSHGNKVNQLVPGKWYEIRQSADWLNVRFDWQDSDLMRQ